MQNDLNYDDVEDYEETTLATKIFGKHLHKQRLEISTMLTPPEEEDFNQENSDPFENAAAFPTWSVVVGFLLIIFIIIYCIRRFVCRKPYEAVALGMTSNDDRKESF